VLRKYVSVGVRGHESPLYGCRNGMADRFSQNRLRNKMTMGGSAVFNRVP
jgi:hypothetical protein